GTPPTAPRGAAAPLVSPARPACRKRPPGPTSRRLVRAFPRRADCGRVALNFPLQAALTIRPLDGRRARAIHRRRRFRLDPRPSSCENGGGVPMDSSILKAVGFVHLHVHSAFSLREGALGVE